MKAQTSTETIIITVTIFFILSIMLSLMTVKSAETGRIQEAIEKSNACESFANDVKSVFVLGNGTKSTIRLDYNMTVSNRTVLVDATACKICCNLTKNASTTYTISGLTKLENRDGQIFVAKPALLSAARYRKPQHTFYSDATSQVIADDGTSIAVNNADRVLHLVFDIPVDKITVNLRCDDDGTVQLKKEGLGSAISNATCTEEQWIWLNLTSNADVFDLNSDNTDIDYDFVGAVW